MARFPCGGPWQPHSVVTHALPNISTPPRSRLPTVGTIGNAPKDVFRGPGIDNWDLSFFKNFPIRERATVQFRWEMYNAFNHPSFQGVNTSASFAAPGSDRTTEWPIRTDYFHERAATRDARLPASHILIRHGRVGG